MFSYGGHFVYRSGTILAIFVTGSPKKHFCEVSLKSVYRSLKVFLVLALAAILFSGEK